MGVNGGEGAVHLSDASRHIERALWNTSRGGPKFRSPLAFDCTSLFSSRRAASTASLLAFNFCRIVTCCLVAVASLCSKLSRSAAAACLAALSFAMRVRSSSSVRLDGRVRDPTATLSSGVATTRSRNPGGLSAKHRPAFTSPPSIAGDGVSRGVGVAATVPTCVGSTPHTGTCCRRCRLKSAPKLPSELASLLLRHARLLRLVSGATSLSPQPP